MKKRTRSILCLALSLMMLASCGENGGQASGGSYTGYGSEYIVSHEEGTRAEYTFEAEYTNLGNKFGTAFSGERSETNMVVEGDSTASNGYAVAGLCKRGLSVNFVIVSDREVEDATLTLRIGNEQAPDIPFTISADTFQVRVDPVNEADTYPYDAEESGAWGNWDADFLAVYAEDGYLPFAGYYVDEWDCGEIEFAATSSTPSGFDDHVITTQLKLYEGLNCISLITNNDDIPDAGAYGSTLFATAPVVDCIKIETEAQLGMYEPLANQSYLDLSNACTVAS